MLGDVDFDSDVDTMDYIKVKRAVMGTYTMTELEELAADVNVSDSLKMSDYILIKRHAMGTFVIAQP